LKEGCFSGLHTGVAGWDKDIEGGDGAGAGGGGDFFGEDYIASFVEVGVGEDEADVAFDVGKEALPFWEVGDETFDRAADLDEWC